MACWRCVNTWASCRLLALPSEAKLPVAVDVELAAGVRRVGVEVSGHKFWTLGSWFRAYVGWWCGWVFFFGGGGGGGDTHRPAGSQNPYHLTGVGFRYLNTTGKCKKILSFSQPHLVLCGFCDCVIIARLSGGSLLSKMCTLRVLWLSCLWPTKEEGCGGGGGSLVVVFIGGVGMVWVFPFSGWHKCVWMAVVWWCVYLCVNGGSVMMYLSVCEWRECDDVFVVRETQQQWLVCVVINPNGLAFLYMFLN